MRELELLERGVLDHQPPLAPVGGKAHGDDAAWLDPRDDPLAERAVTHGVAGRQRGDVVILSRSDLARRLRVPRPGRRPQPLAGDARRELVEEARREVVLPATVE